MDLRPSIALVLSLTACGHGPTVRDDSTAPQSPQPRADDDAPRVAEPGSERSCQTDDDCSAVQQACSWEAVSVEHRAAAQRRIDEHDISVSCDSTGGPVVATSAGCEQGECEIRYLEQIEWRDCTSDADCVAVQAACGAWDAAGTAHVTAMRAHYEGLAARVRCASRESPPAAPTPICRVGLCVPR